MNGKILSQQLTLGQDGSLFAYTVNNNEYLNYRYNYSNISGQKLRIEVCHQSTVQKPVLSLYGTFSWDSKYAGSQFSSSITGSKIIFLFYVIFFPTPDSQFHVSRNIPAGLYIPDPCSHFDFCKWNKSENLFFIVNFVNFRPSLTFNMFNNTLHNLTRTLKHFELWILTTHYSTFMH